jgi:hypothetical protein
MIFDFVEKEALRSRKINLDIRNERLVSFVPVSASIAASSTAARSRQIIEKVGKKARELVAPE